MLLLSVYETFLYYCCLLLVCRFILNCSPKKFYLYGSFIAFIPLVLIAISGNNTLHNIAYVAFGICQFLLIKLIYKTARLYYVVFLYIFIYTLGAILISAFSSISTFSVVWIDVVTNTAIVLLCVIVCLTKIRYKCCLTLTWLPRYFLTISSVLLISTLIISAVIFRVADKVSIWNRVLPIALFILQMAICIILPVFLFNTISTNRLKSLTASYEQQIETQAKYYKELAAANYESRRFKHDFNNMRIAIEKLLADGENEQALQLIQECGNTMDKPAGIPIAFDTGNGIADALLTDKQQRAGLCNAVICFQGVIPQDALLPTDLCVILGNTLDNAIEACQRLPKDTEKNIQITCNCNSGFLFLTVCNPIAEKVSVYNNHIATTKEDKALHGFGLYSLRSVVKKYNGELRIHSSSDFFTVEIDLCVTLTQTEPSIT